MSVKTLDGTSYKRHTKLRTDEDRMTIKKHSTNPTRPVVLTARLSQDLKRRLDQAARIHDCTRTDVVLHLLENGVLGLIKGDQNAKNIFE
jgi:hypothetical protein